MNLKDLKVLTKTVTAEFPGLEGFEVKVAFVSREASTKLREAATVTKIDSKLKMPVQELDQDIFIEKFVASAIKGWTGFKYKYLSDLMLVDLSSVEDTEKELEFTLENAVELLKGSQAFDTWINEVIFDLERFRD